MRAPRVIVGALSALVGVIFLVIHLQLHPIPYSAYGLQDDPPRSNREVILTTDNAYVLETRADGILVVGIDQFSDNAILVAPPFAPDPPFRGGRVYVFDAAWPDEPAFEERTYSPFDAETSFTLLSNVVWEADRAQQMPAPWMAGIGIALLALGLVAFAPPFAWAGAAAALGFAASHGAAFSPYYAPTFLLWGTMWLCAIAAGITLLLAIPLRSWRPRLPIAAVLGAFALGVWAEGEILGGYRPFTGIF